LSAGKEAFCPSPSLEMLWPSISFWPFQPTSIRPALGHY